MSLLDATSLIFYNPGLQQEAEATLLRPRGPCGNEVKMQCLTYLLVFAIMQVRVVAIPSRAVAGCIGSPDVSEADSASDCTKIWHSAIFEAINGHYCHKHRRL